MKIGPIKFAPLSILSTVCFVAYGLDQWLASPQGTPLATMLHIPSQVLVVVGVGILYFAQSVLHIDPSNPPAAGSQRGFAHVDLVRLLASVATVGAIAAILAHCALFGQVEAPVVDCGKRALDDAAKGMTVVQIVEDVAAPCGMDAAAVISSLLASQNAQVKTTKAYSEAVKIRDAALAAKASP